MCVYHLGSFIQIITGQDLQGTGSDQSFGVIHSGPLRFNNKPIRLQNNFLGVLLWTIVHTLLSHAQLYL